MANIKKSLIGVRGALMVALLSSPSASFAMEDNKENINKSPNKSFIKENASEKEIEDELKKLFDEHLDAMKQASKAVSKKLKLDPPKSKKHQK